MREGEDVGVHVNFMIRSIEELESLDFSMDFHLQMDPLRFEFDLENLVDKLANSTSASATEDKRPCPLFRWL